MRKGLLDLQHVEKLANKWQVNSTNSTATKYSVKWKLVNSETQSLFVCS